jgi:hypothetical protein
MPEILPENMLDQMWIQVATGRREFLLFKQTEKKNYY